MAMRCVARYFCADQINGEMVRTGRAHDTGKKRADVNLKRENEGNETPMKAFQ
jgi:hypothetical protein